MVGRFVMAIVSLAVLCPLAVISAYALARSLRASEPAAAAVASYDARACSLGPKILGRIRRGYIQNRSEDIVFVLRGKNYLGSFKTISHSGPRDFLQRVPLVLYGPRIEAEGVLDRPVTLADVYPTVGQLMDIELPERRGRVLSEALVGTAGIPRLLVVVMWDGVGRNVLDRWPGAWPTLARLEADGTSFLEATVGSSPSITPATHSTLGTGTFPRNHGVTSIKFRRDNGAIGESFKRRNPRELRLSTFADEIDLAFDNQPQVGMLAWRNWHMGMLGHGATLEGGDRDHLGLITRRSRITGRREFFFTPRYLDGFPGLDRLADELDARDGVKDGRWRGHDIRADNDNPAWVAYQAKVLHALAKREGYGANETPDVLLTNFKITDIVGHKYSMDSPEMKDVLRAQDDALGKLIGYLDSEVEDYVVIVSADHGHTPSAESSGAWPLVQHELEADLDRRFDVTGSTLARSVSAVGVWVNRGVMDEHNITYDEIATFLNGYTIRDNWGRSQLPSAYRDRGAEPVFDAAFPGTKLDEAVECAASQSTSAP